MDRRVNGSGSRKSVCRRTLPLVLAATAILAVPSVASAQDTSIYLDRLKVAGAPDDGIGVWRPHMHEQTRFFGQLGLGFSLNPFRVENYIDTSDQAPIVERENGAPVSAQLITYVNAGVEVAERFSIQASFPLAVYQAGNSMVNENANIREEVDLKTVVPMDLRLDGRVIVLRNEAKTLKLAVQAAVWLPTGNKFSFGGDNGVSGGFGVAGEYDAKKFAVVVNAGYQFRPTAKLNEFKMADELTYGVGAFMPLKDGQFRVGAQVFGSLGIGDDTFLDVDNTPVEWMAEGRMRLGSNPGQGYVGLGAGTRLSAGYAPDFRAIAVLGGWFPIGDVEPKNDKGFIYKIPADTDGDRFADDIDMCPTDDEDGKGSNPDDGCPELLNDLDSDGVPDSQDACPKEPGPANADPKKNGCPEFIRRMKGSAQIEVLQEVQFAFDQANLLPTAFPILNEVVRLLKVNPDIEIVAIEGHTDDVGSDAHNDELSGARARSVMAYLIKRGITVGRLEAKGFGKRKPIASNQTAEGRQKNRRVEFHITKVKGGELGAPTVPLIPPAGGTPTPGPAAPGTPAAPGSPATPPAGAAPAPGTAAPPAGAAPAPAPAALPKGAAPAPAAPTGSAAPAKGAAPAPAAPTGSAAPAKGAAPAPAAPTGSAAPAKGAAPAAAPPAPATPAKGAAPAAAPPAPAAPAKGAAPAPAAPKPGEMPKRLIN